MNDIKKSKKCLQRGCSFFDIKVETELDKCLGCGNELKNANPFENLFRDMFG